MALIAPSHQYLIEALDQMLAHVKDLADASSQAMNREAAHYEHADLQAEARVDASYPAVPRPPIVE
jgi:hypothetical protein